MRRSLALACCLALLWGCGGSSHPQVEPEKMLDSAAARAAEITALASALGLSSPPSLRGTVRGCVGFDDRVFHELEVDAEVGIPAADRQRLGGTTSAHVDLEIVNSEVGEQQQISIPAGGGDRPIRDLFLTLNDLGVP